MERGPRLTRRQLLHAGALIGTSAILGSDIPWSVRSKPSQEITPTPETEPNMFSVFGLHDAPDIGGSINFSLALSDTKRLGGKSLVIVNPREETQEAASGAGIEVITRWYNQANLCDPDSLRATVQQARWYQEHPVVPPFNETNQRAYTRGVYRPPTQHIEEDFLPALDIIASEGGTTLVTPLAQNVPDCPVDEMEYFREMLITLRRHVSDADIQNHIAIGAHAYITYVGEDIFARLQAMQSITTEVLGFSLPFYLTETGVHASLQKKCGGAVTIAETFRLLQTPLPQDIRIKSFNLWVLANKSQRKRYGAEHAQEIDSFEPAALRKRYGETELFRSIEAYAQQAKNMLQYFSYDQT